MQQAACGCGIFINLVVTALCLALPMSATAVSRMKPLLLLAAAPLGDLPFQLTDQGHEVGNAWHIHQYNSSGEDLWKLAMPLCVSSLSVAFLTHCQAIANSEVSQALSSVDVLCWQMSLSERTCRMECNLKHIFKCSYLQVLQSSLIPRLEEIVSCTAYYAKPTRMIRTDVTHLILGSSESWCATPLLVSVATHTVCSSRWHSV